MAHYTETIKKLQQFKREMSTLVGNEIVNFALDNLDAEIDKNGAKLKPRKSNAPRNSRRRILKDTGDGDRSIQIGKKTAREVTVVANDYMAAHNEGAHIIATAKVKQHTRRRNGRNETVKAHTRNVNTQLPTREFLGPGKKLDTRIVNTLSKRFKTLTK